MKEPNRNSFSAKLLILFDGIGALLSAFMIAVVLVKLNHLIGMPIPVLKYLALAAFIFFIYDVISYFFVKSNHHKFLAFIAIVNLIYAIISFSLLFIHSQTLTTLGFAYFIIEILILLVLATFELKIASKK